MGQEKASGGFAGFAKFFHYRLDEFLGVVEFLGDHAQIHSWHVGIALTGAVDAVLTDQDESIGDAVQGDGKAAAVATITLLGVFKFVAMFVKGGHVAPSVAPCPCCESHTGWFPFISIARS